MHVHYKFGLFLIFILSSSTHYTRAAPATNQSSSYNDYTDDYDDYYDDHVSDNQVQVTTAENRQDYSSTENPSTTLQNRINGPSRSNHVLEPTCPKSCYCLEDYKYVQCANAQLKHVPDNLPITALVIDLSYNQITELKSDDFANTTKVREINLNHNELTSINKESFVGLKRLQRLYLANNGLNDIEPDTFNGASDLTSLDLSNNSINLPNEGSFLNQSSLRELSCRNCSWTELYDDTFSELSSLTSLKLDHNDFNKKINPKAFTPLVNLIKLKLPELDEENIQQLCNLLKAIDNISFKHFDVSCFELVLGTSFNKSLILVTDPPYIPPPDIIEKNNYHTEKNSADVAEMENNNDFANYSPPTHDNDKNLTTIVLTAGILDPKTTENSTTTGLGETTYQVPVSQEIINIMLIAIMVIAVIGIIIGVLCRKDVGGIKTKCCRTRKADPKDQVHPAEEIPLNKLA